MLIFINRNYIFRLYPSGGGLVIFSGLFSMLNTGYMHIWRGLCPSFKYNHCQHISSVGLAHYNCSFMKCDTVNSDKKVFFFFCMSREFNWNSGIWRIFPERLQTPGGYGFGQQTCHIDGFPPLQQHPKLRLLWIFLTLWNCQSSQWPGQALSLWHWGFKMVPTKQHGRRIWKRHNELEKKNPSYLGNKTRGRRENVEEREKGGEKKKSVTDWPSLPSIPQPILSPRSERQAFLVLRGVTERKAGTKKEKERKKVRAHPKRGGEQERREWQGGGIEGEQLESLSSAPSRWIGLMNASECWGAMASSIKAGNTAQI